MKIVSVIIALCGLWECADIAAVVTPGFGHISAFVWSHIAAGLVALIAGLWATLTRRASTAKTLHWLAAAAGAWLMVAPLVVGRPEIAAGVWNDLIVGLIVLVLGAWGALARPRAMG